jgi:Zn-dependent protease with chaperone function
VSGLIAELRGDYFDGRSSRPQPVTIELLSPDLLRLQAADWRRDHPLKALRLEVRPGATPALLHLPEDGVVEVWEWQRLADGLGPRPGLRCGRWLRWVEGHGVGVLGSLVVATAIGVLGVTVGLPAFAWLGTQLVPVALERRLGERVLADLDGGGWLTPSQLPQRRQQALQRLFAELRPHLPVGSERLELRSSEAIGANALALPAGILVLSDDLVALADGDQLRAVLAHEAGHAHHRHGLQTLIRQQGLAMLWLLASGRSGDLQVFSQVLVQRAYSRAFELQADREAVAVLRRQGIPAGRLFDLLDRLEQRQGHPSGPSWLRSHPEAAQRRRSAMDQP